MKVLRYLLEEAGIFVKRKKIGGKGASYFVRNTIARKQQALNYSDVNEAGIFLFVLNTKLWLAPLLVYFSTFYLYIMPQISISFF